MVKALIEKAMLKSGSKRPVYISFDEWSGGFGNNITASLMVGQHLNSFIRHADIVKMANITMLSSLAGSSLMVLSRTHYFMHSIFTPITVMDFLDVYTNCENIAIMYLRTSLILMLPLS